MINLSVDIGPVLKEVMGIKDREIPYTVARTLTETGKDAIKELRAEAVSVFDRPVKFTENAWSHKYASKNNLVTEITIRPIQYEYLKYQIDGGLRMPKKKKHPIPKNIKLNQYGNMPKSKIQQLLAKTNTFQGTINGVTGIWERGHKSKTGKWSSRSKSRSTSVRLLVKYVPEARYEKKFYYYAIVKNTFQRQFNRNFNRVWARAVKGKK